MKQREIKFRAWDKNIKEMLPVTGIYWDAVRGQTIYVTYQESTISYDKDDMESEGWPIENLTLMQYTGVKDRNGKEIWCSDIVRGYFDVDLVEDWVYMQLSKEEIKDGSKVFEIADNLLEYAQQLLPDELEVIGNIYQDSHLLFEDSEIESTRECDNSHYAKPLEDINEEEHSDGSIDLCD